MKLRVTLVLAVMLTLAIGWLAGSHLAVGQNAPSGPQMKKWKQGAGWGWVWGKEDEVGSLNEMTDTSRAAALRLAQSGKVYDLGVSYSRRSYKWPGHSPGEIMSFRSPGGESAQKDRPAAAKIWQGIVTLYSDKAWAKDLVDQAAAKIAEKD